MMNCLLKDYGADLFAKTTSGETCFHLAVRLENVFITQLLVGVFEEELRKRKSMEAEEEDEAAGRQICQR